MKTFFVVNPRSASGSTGRRWGELASRIARVLSDFGVEFTKGPMDAAHITSRALRHGYDCIVAVGGDGTINEVVNGFFEDGQCLNPRAALGVLPRGTGGDFRRTFDWDDDFDAAVRRLDTPDSRPFDVGRVELVGPQGQPLVRHFANVFSFGVSGAVVREANQGTIKNLGGRITFFAASLKALWPWRDKAVRVSVDGQPPEVMLVTTLALGNGKYFGGGMKVAPAADVSDGLLDCTLWSGYGLADFVLKSQGLYNGNHVRYAGTRTFRCKGLRAEADEEVLVDCDGEQAGRLPIRVSVLPGAIRLKV